MNYQETGYVLAFLLGVLVGFFWCLLVCPARPKDQP